MDALGLALFAAFWVRSRVYDPPVRARLAVVEVSMGVVALLRERLTAARAYLGRLERAESEPDKAPEEDLRLAPYV